LDVNGRVNPFTKQERAFAAKPALVKLKVE
jgi:hypothetical protein